MKKFILQVILMFILLAGILVSVNYFVDASEVITPRSYGTMAKLALAGNIVTAPENYNERLYQIHVINEMNDIPETIVIGCSRGMFLGREITGFENLYNNCVSGGCIEDYYAILGMYYKKFSKLPARVIVEASPWIFYENIPEARWKEQYIYKTSAQEFYYKINNRDLVDNLTNENPYFSVSYFQYNLSKIREKGLKAFVRDNEARISTNPAEAADYPDGSIRYKAEVENQSENRLSIVKAQKGAVTYQNADKMTAINRKKINDFENLLNFLFNNDVEIIIYMQPFSVTQCYYIYDKGTNLIFAGVEKYLHEFGEKHKLKVIGGYDSRKYNISDKYFIDFMHLDKAGTKIIWDFDNKLYFMYNTPSGN